MSEVMRYGVIGCGMMGQEHLRNIALLPSASVASIFEPDLEMAARAQALAPQALLASSIEELLSVEALNGLLIASPNHCHLAQMEEIGRRRPLPILVEKPLFTNLGDQARLDAFTAHYPAPVWVAMEYRFMPPIAELVSRAEAATGGVKMLTIREHRYPFLEKVGNWNRFHRYTGGTFVEKCCHFFDLMRLILQSDPIRVTASAGQAVNHLDERYGGEIPDIHDHGYVVIDFASGSRAMLELCMFAEGSRYQEEISAVGPVGKIEALVPGPARFWPEHLGTPPVARVIVSPRSPKGPEIVSVPVDEKLLAAGDHNGSTFFQHCGFLELLQGRRHAPEVTLEDGRMAVLMGLAAQRSAATGQTVYLESFVQGQEAAQ